MQVGGCEGEKQGAEALYCEAVGVDGVEEAGDVVGGDWEDVWKEA